jgi:hypothetical protein
MNQKAKSARTTEQINKNSNDFNFWAKKTLYQDPESGSGSGSTLRLNPGSGSALRLMRIRNTGLYQSSWLYLSLKKNLLQYKNCDTK